MSAVTGKPCSKCQRWKPFSEYWLHKNRKDGHATICKLCSKKLYTEPNAERMRQRAREWQKANPARAQYNQRKALMKRMGIDRPTYTDAEWQSLLQQYGNRCLRCGRAAPDVKIVADHVQPLARGGADTIENIQPLCEECNAWKHAEHIDFRGGAACVVFPEIQPPDGRTEQLCFF